MAIEAPTSKYRKNNLKIFIAIMVICAIWFAYDGYFNEEFKEKYTDANGNPDSTLVFNQKSPPFFAAAAAILIAYLFSIRNKKLLADESELVISAKEKIPYASIEKIDKTNFDKKGYFIITYKDETGLEINRRINDKKYDNLTAVLDELVKKIS